MRTKFSRRIDAARLAGEVAAGQNGHIIFTLQAEGEFGIGDPGVRAHR
jgi:hypothetical protein